MLNMGCYHHLDKDIGSTIPPAEDPCDDFFEQWLNQDPPTISDTAAPSEDFHNYDFVANIDEETGSSGSYSNSTESKEAPSLSSSHHHQRQQPTASSSLGPSPPPQSTTAPLLRSQPPPLLARCEAPTLKGAISSAELLNLEGKLFFKRRQSKAPSISSSSSSAAVPTVGGGTLRRKAKFCAPAPDIIQRGRSQKVVKAPSSEMMRPSYLYRQETPGCHEWTQRFEQISLQTPNNTPQMSPSRTRGSFRDNRPGNIVTSPSRQSTPQQPKAATRISDGKSSEAPPQETSTTPQTSFFKPLSSAPMLHSQMRDADFNSMPSTSGEVEVEDMDEENEHGHARRLRHPPSWNHLPISPLELEFSTMSPSHVHPSWLHRLPENVNVGSYQHNASAAHPSTPGNGPPPASDYNTSPGAFLVQYEPYDQFVTEDPSTSYSIVPSHPLRSPPGVEERIPIALFGDDDPDLVVTGPPPTQPPPPHHHHHAPRLTRSQSVSPPALHHHHNHQQRQHSPSRQPQHNRSKSRSRHKKTKSVGQLKQPKSSTTLSKAATRSHGNIKSPTKPSTSTSTSASAAGAAAGNPPTSISSSFDNFVNFTAHDSDRILTGVAPSGSSKTKARREQEANEKKRKLSMAALRAIEELGGDVNAMEILKAEFDE